MKPEIKKLWVQALRSGKYKQGRGQLRTADNKFCCLGVLCNLHAQAHPKLAGRQWDPVKYLGSTALLPIKVMKWAGIPYHSGSYVHIKGKHAPLTHLNDHVASFKEIAKAIEQQL